MLEADYLIVGSGAMGMAFADTLLSETDASIIIVDRYAKPGGHWNHAYPFVTLHQPSQFYGVASKELSKNRKDAIGWNKGLFDLATGAEVMVYFEEVMRDTFLTSGRVQYFPSCNYNGNFKFKSLISGEEYEVKVNKKLIDCTYLKTTIPFSHKPNFSVANEVNFFPINNLVNIKSVPEGYVIIGGGKTGIDACLWLLQNNVDPEKITWIVSRDAWLIDRQNTQPSMEFFERTIGNQANQFEAISQSNSIGNLFEDLEAAGTLVRIDKTIRPQMFHGATISQMEIEQMRRIKNVIRMGKVKQIETDKIILEKGTIPTSVNHVHVDCSASAVTNLETKPIFEKDKITPQTIRPYQPIFSASVIAYIEANYDDDKVKNNFCQVVPLPNHDTDWIRMMAIQMVNQMSWNQDKSLRNWIRQNRLDGFGQLVKDVDKEDAPKMTILMRLKNAIMPAMMKLQQYMVELESEKS